MNLFVAVPAIIVTFVLFQFVCVFYPLSRSSFPVLHNKQRVLIRELNGSRLHLELLEFLSDDRYRIRQNLDLTFRIRSSHVKVLL